MGMKSKNFNEENKNKKEVVLSKNDFVPKDEINIYIYKLKEIKNIKIPLELDEVKEKKKH